MTITASAALIRPPAHASPPQRAHHAPAILTGRPSDRYRRAHRPTARPAAPNYALRRCAVALAAVLCAFVAVPALGAVMASLGGAPAAAAEASQHHQVSPTRHVAVAGDTLWSIASTHRGEVSHERYLDALIRLNGGTSIEVGQAVILP